MEFLLFRLPQESSFKLIKNQEVGEKLASFFPFDEGSPCYISSKEIINLEKEQVLELSSQITLPKNQDEFNFPTQKEYLNKICQAIEEIKNNNLHKLVISRQKNICFEQIDLINTFLCLCEKYTGAFCYVWVGKEQVWIGATPELLGSFDKRNGVFKTMSLAGTLPVEEKWTEKEMEEQNIVTQYIGNVLRKFSNNVEVTEANEYVLGSIKHLRTDFEASIEYQDLNALIEELHPTPAVCGVPKDFCKEKILEIEGYDRSFYTGYIKIETPTEVCFFVNLRCMRVFEGHSVIYVGGGITKDSNPDKEWQETELKAGTILDYLK